jgi:hypothetical protein
MLAAALMSTGAGLVSGGSRSAGAPRAFASPYGRRFAWIAPSYPRNDRHKNAAQVKRAAGKATNRARNKGHHHGR